MSFAGKTAVITGSNSGIGLGIAREMAKAGVNVVLNSFSDSADDHALASGIVAEFGVEAKYIAADMSKSDDCRRLIVEAGRCDILVNNVGIQHVAPIEDFPAGKWDAIIAINLSSAFHTTAAALPGMRENGWGRIVNIASIAGKEGNPNLAAYSASKAAVIGLTKSIGKELATTGVLVNSVAPAVIATEMNALNTPEVLEYMISKIPMSRTGTADEVAALVAWLSSEECSFSTGACYDISGGRATY